MGYQEDQIYESAKIKTLTKFWFAVVVVVVSGGLGLRHLLNVRAGMNPMTAESCKAVCTHGVGHFGDGVCDCSAAPPQLPDRPLPWKCECGPVRVP